MGQWLSTRQNGNKWKQLSTRRTQTVGMGYIYGVACQCRAVYQSCFLFFINIHKPFSGDTTAFRKQMVPVPFSMGIGQPKNGLVTKTCRHAMDGTWIFNFDPYPNCPNTFFVCVSTCQHPKKWPPWYDAPWIPPGFSHPHHHCPSSDGTASLQPAFQFKVIGGNLMFLNIRLCYCMYCTVHHY